MSRIPIRLRLTLAFALVTALVLAGAGWFVEARVGDDLARALDQDLRARAQDLSALVLHGGSLRNTRGGLIEPGETFAQLVDSRGRLVDSTGTVAAGGLLRPGELAQARGGPSFVDRPAVPGLDEPARMLAIPLERDGRKLVLVVGGTRENRAETLRSLRAAFLVGGPLALILASLAGYVLAGAALRPVEAMRRRAREISSTSLNERLPVPETNDEVARLGETLNEMLARLEDGLAREQRFVADAAHELRTPLALLRTELELALRHERTPEQLEAAIRAAAEEADRLGRITDDLLLLARSEQGRLPLRLEPTDLADLLQRVASRFAPAARAEGRTIAVDADSAPVATIDPLRIEQALGNMLDNAIRHGGGRVQLTATAAGGTVELHVLDDGPGFADELAGHEFERFSRADDSRAGAGSGLGLAIVETIARAHGGTAHVANRAGGGADVWLTLPADAVPQHETADPRAAGARVPTL